MDPITKDPNLLDDTVTDTGLHTGQLVLLAYPQAEVEVYVSESVTIQKS